MENRPLLLFNKGFTLNATFVAHGLAGAIPDPLGLPTVPSSTGARPCPRPVRVGPHEDTVVVTMPTALMLVATAVLAEPGIVDVKADPPVIRFAGRSARHRILVEGVGSEGQAVDLTRSARYRSLDPSVASVDGGGVVRPVGDGGTTVMISAGGHSRAVEVRVAGSRTPRSFNFTNEIVPVLSKLGCNASGCHGKAEGQYGFKLSVFGFDPEGDHAAITRASGGRRVFPAAPERSLLLTKMAGVVPHGGGVRADQTSEDYRLVRDWIAAGAPFGSAGDPRVVSIRVEPRERRLEMTRGQQLRVTARYLRRARGRRDRARQVPVQQRGPGQGRRRRPGHRGAYRRGRRGDGVLSGFGRPLPGLDPAPGRTRGRPRPRRRGRREALRGDRRPGRSQAAGTEHRAVGAVHRRGIPPAGPPRRDRHAAHARRGAAVPGRPRPRPTRPAGRQVARPPGIRGVLGVEVVGPAPG